MKNIVKYLIVTWMALQATSCHSFAFHRASKRTKLNFQSKYSELQQLQSGNPYRSLQKNLCISSISFQNKTPARACLKFSTKLQSHEESSEGNSKDDENKLIKSPSSASVSSKFGTALGIRKDVIIIGGGLAGLSIGLSLAQSGRHVTIVEKNSLEGQYSKSNNAGSFAAAGMLAPQSERLPMGPLLDLCLQSRRMYTEFVQGVEGLAKNCGKEGEKYLWREGHPEGKVVGMDGNGGMERWEVGFQATGGFLAPAFAGDSVATWAPPPGGGVAYWLDEIQVRELEPQIHPDVIGGWWFPEDASVDARRLTCSLRAACVAAGVHIQMGPETAAVSLELSDGRCNGVHLADGRVFNGNSIIVANGSWMRELLPVPITPHKGQSFSLRMPPNTPPILSRVLFAQDTYIVPKSDGRIVVGATVEPGSFDPNVTPKGLMHCMNSAIGLVPALADLPLEETWSGLRPTTPDKGPILGKTAWDNLVVAGGYWRNGVLLAPKTAQLISDLVNDNLSKDDEILLEQFSWDRFTSPEGGTKIAAASRYAASMHPVHNRASGMGISASVGTELGFYSDASAAGAERKRDRQALFGDSDAGDSSEDMEAAFEKAAALGKRDITAFENGDSQLSLSNLQNINKGGIEKKEQIQSQKKQSQTTKQMPTESISDALTVGASEEGNFSTDIADIDHDSKDLTTTYEAIKENKAKMSTKLEMGDRQQNDRPDPGFRIYHIDEETGEQTLVPPYTKEGAMRSRTVSEKSNIARNPEATETVATDISTESKSNSSEEGLYDGYTMIQKANSSTSRKEELEAMKKARMNNRLDKSEINTSKIGAKRMEMMQGENELPLTPSSNLQSIYQHIKSNKAEHSATIEMGDKTEEDRPSFPFQIFHIDEETGEQRLVPPYTTQAAMAHLISQEKNKAVQTMNSNDSTDFSMSLENGQNDHPEKNEKKEEKPLYDGYDEIQKANGSMNRKEELNAMRKARINNRENFGGVISEDRFPQV